MKKAMSKYAKLEVTLKKSLLEVESRERVLEAAENKAKQEHASKMVDLQALHRRLRDEMSHKVCFCSIYTVSANLLLPSHFILLKVEHSLSFFRILLNNHR